MCLKDVHVKEGKEMLLHFQKESVRTRGEEVIIDKFSAQREGGLSDDWI